MTTLVSGARVPEVRYNAEMTETFILAPDDSLAKSVRPILIVSTVITGCITLAATLFYFITQPVIPLMYTLARPEQALVPKIWLFVFPLASVTITVLHIFLIAKCKDLEELILKLFAWVTVVIQVLILAVLIRILAILW